MTEGTSDDYSNRKRIKKRAPTALKLAPSRRYGSEAPWFMGVVLQQACQAMTRRST